MVENQHRKITGYRDLTPEEIEAMNSLKTLEVTVAQAFAKARDVSVARVLADGQRKPEELHEVARQASLARTHAEEAFMHAVRSVARPDSPWLLPHSPWVAGKGRVPSGVATSPPTDSDVGQGSA